MDWDILVAVETLALCTIVGLYYACARRRAQTARAESPARIN